MDATMEDETRTHLDLESAANALDSPQSNVDGMDLMEEGSPLPRGRLAGKMAGDVFIEEASSSEDEEMDPHEIYLKMKQQMAGTQEKAEVQEKPSPKKPTALDSSEEDSPVRRPVRTYRQLSPLHRSNPQSPLPSAAASLSQLSSRHSSPGIFVSPAKSTSQTFTGDKVTSGSDADSDVSTRYQPTRRKPAKQLVARRRKQRQNKATATEASEPQSAEPQPTNIDLSEDDEQLVDTNVEDMLTQAARPTRKASKKAIEEMNRETQRMNRNMQLTHQAKVKTKHTVQDFVARMQRNRVKAQTSSPHGKALFAAAHSSDIEEPSAVDTPPSSPPSISEDIVQKPVILSKEVLANGSDEDLPDVDLSATKGAEKVDKGKQPLWKNTARKVSRQIRVKLPAITQPLDDEDDELEIVKDRFPVFSNLPQQTGDDSRPLLTLRRLAHLGGTESVRGKNKFARPSMTSAELDVQLLKRARLQAKQEQEQRIADLKARGIIFTTDKERERLQMEVDNGIEKAREEAEALRLKEKRERKKDGDDEIDMLASDDESEDEEYVASDDQQSDAGIDDEDEPIVLSGSEDEEDNSVDDAESEDEDIVDMHAEAEHIVVDEDMDPSAERGLNDHRNSRKKRVIEDEEDDEDEHVPTSAATPVEPTPSAAAEDLAAAFDFGSAPEAPLGLSQMFAGTMEGSPTQRDTQAVLADIEAEEEDSMDIFRRMPWVPAPTFGAAVDDVTQTVAIEDSQTALESQTQTGGVNFNYTPTRYESPAITRLTQLSSVPSPSQDMGFATREMPTPRETPQSTIDTVILGVPESPVAQKKGRLRIRAAVIDSSDDEAESTAKPSDAFKIMSKAAAKPTESAFDKKKSNAKNMFEEQAEESEDEYAGLGGASDEGSGDEADEADRAMIDESEIKVDERKLMAFHAEKDRIETEAQTSKLYKDLMSGALRRSRGGAFDLDSDEDDQIAESRRRKQREEARKRRLLLADGNLGELGDSNKSEAFLRAIEDRDGDDDGELLDGRDPDEEQNVPDSQQDTSQITTDGRPQPLVPTSGNALKRKRDGDDERQSLGKRAVGLARRTYDVAFHKPASFAEVRESVSFLIDDPHGDEVSATHLYDLEHEDGPGEETEVAVERAPYNARRTAAKSDIVDRLLLKKTSTSAEQSDSRGSSLAFHARSLTMAKTPSLLRRATTNQSTASILMPPPALKKAPSTETGVRRGGSKKSSINYASREAERQIAVGKVEKKRAENVKKIAALRQANGLASMKAFTGGFE